MALTKTEPGAHDANSGTKSPERPGLPSWADRLIDWVRRFPVPAWLFYAGSGLTLALVYSAVKWSDGSYPVGEFRVVHVLVCLTGPAYLAWLHFLDDQAGSAIDEFRPVLIATDDEYRALRHQLTTLPARPALLWGLLTALLLWTGMFMLDQRQANELGIFTSPVATAFEYAIAFVAQMAVTATVVQAIRQLSLVNRIYTQRTRIDLFNLEPLYAFSRLAARAALSGLVLTYAWILLWPGLWQDLSDAAWVIGSWLLFIVPFVLPLLGVHRLLKREKARRRAEAGHHLNAVIAALHRDTTAGDYSQMSGIADAMESLVRERDVLAKVPTWPWEPETVRWLATALFVPVALWFITRLVERFLVL